VNEGARQPLSHAPELEVSIVLLTYQHAAFVRRAVRSIYEQRGVARAELIAADDSSPDGTGRMLRELASEAPAWLEVRLLSRPARLGMHANLLDALGEVRAPLIALLEGDDYWCCPDKLARQLHVLATDPAVYLVGHRTAVETGAELRRVEWRLHPWRTRFDVGDYVQRLFLHTSSIVMRHHSDLPAWLLHIMQLDQALVTLGARQNCREIHLLPEFMSVYTRHPGGITNSPAHRDKARALWSHARLICGLLRARPWLPRIALRRKLAEVRFQRRAVGLGPWRRCLWCLRHPIIAGRLVVYSLHAAFCA
jgi:glycosyltransferase involved in cell wall biosynthesis